jgi:hypothetical protein
MNAQNTPSATTPEKTIRIPINRVSMTVAAATALWVTGCATAPEATLADGASVRALIEQQTHDPAATARHGTTTPQGTDPDVVNAAVQGVRAPAARGAGSTSRPSMLDLISGSGSR